MSLYERTKTTIPPHSRRAIKQRLNRWLDTPARHSALVFVKEAALGLRQSEGEFGKLVAANGLKVHLGCGADVRTGWVNIDLSIPAAVRDAVDDGTSAIEHDLRRGLDLPDSSCVLIYSCHFFEHLEYRDGTALMRDCYRVLAPGGRFRIVLPNLRSVFSAYLSDDSAYFDLLPLPSIRPDVERGTESIVDWINYSVYQHGEHRTIYDEEKLRRLLSVIGFRDIHTSAHDPTVDPVTPERLRYSMYIEAVK